MSRVCSEESCRELLCLGDSFPPGNVRSERTCSREWNQLSLISSELSSGVTELSFSRLEKPTQGISPPQQGLPQVPCCARMV